MQQDSHQPDYSLSYQNNPNNNQDNAPSIFRVDLNNAQFAYLARLLPTSYSFQLELKQAKRATSSQKNLIEEVRLPLEVKKKSIKEEAKSNTSKSGGNRNQKNNNKINEEVENAVYQRYSTQKEIPKRNTFDGISESLKPCVKILSLLKNSRTSWPFREPVDAVALGIPHYTDIVKEPMDLSTIENNLRTNQYLTPTQFYADVSKIITNSYTFNSSDIEFTRITAEFESYYRKITSEPSEVLQRGYSQNQIPTEIYTHKSTEKKLKKESSKDHEFAATNNVISMNEKKELGFNIKKLPKEHMKGILDIVNEGKVKTVGQFDLKQLDTHLIRKLQQYVKEKLSGQGKPKQTYGHQKVKESRDREESSFELDEEDQS